MRWQRSTRARSVRTRDRRRISKYRSITKKKRMTAIFFTPALSEKSKAIDASRADRPSRPRTRRAAGREGPASGRPHSHRTRTADGTLHRIPTNPHSAHQHRADSVSWGPLGTQDPLCFRRTCNIGSEHIHWHGMAMVRYIGISKGSYARGRGPNPPSTPAPADALRR